MREIDLDRVTAALQTYHHSWLVQMEEEPEVSLHALLSKQLPHVDRESWSERIQWGGVYLDGHPVNGDLCPLFTPCWIEYFEPKCSLAEAAQKIPDFNPQENIVFEDDYLIVVFKPAKLPCMPAKEQRLYSLHRALCQYLEDDHQLHMPSRLDLSTAGLVIASKHPRMHAALQQAFERRRIDKWYLVQVEGNPDWDTITLDAPIGIDPRHPVLRCVDENEGKSATTHFDVVDRDAGVTTLLAKPVTGRTHQIRVHCAELGFPVIGDNFYNGQPAKQLHLLSYRIRFERPAPMDTLDIHLPFELSPQWIKRILKTGL